jgi:hypothetical protein
MSRLANPNIEKMSYEQIAAVDNVSFEVAGTSFILPKQIVQKFYDAFQECVRSCDEMRIFTFEQPIFAMMLKRGYGNLMEFAVLDKPYHGLYAAIAHENNNGSCPASLVFFSNFLMIWYRFSFR